MIDSEKLLIADWKHVDKYLQEDNINAMKLAIIEAEKIFIKIVNSKGYKQKGEEQKISLAIKELKSPNPFLKAREKAIRLIKDVGFDLNDLYSGKEIVDSYKEAIKELLFGVIDGKRLQSFKYRFWNLYFFIYSRRSFLKKFFITSAIMVLLMLFIADTDLGRNLFDLLIEKIHLIIRVILVAILLLFSIFFFVTFSIIIFESKARKRVKRDS